MNRIGQRPHSTARAIILLQRRSTNVEQVQKTTVVSLTAELITSQSGGG